jgi:hypothetical protein
MLTLSHISIVFASMMHLFMMILDTRFKRTATSEGAEMTRVLSTLSQMEKSRFEAYRRCTFSAKAIREYVAHMLLEHAEHLKDRTRVSMGLLGSDGCGTGVPHLERSIERMKTTTTTSTKYYFQRQRKLRPLHDLVQPGSADSIVVIVTALAKAYAQRLVAAARRVSGDSHGPIRVEHIQAAYEARVRGGVDPGFSISRPSRRRAFSTSSSMLWCCQGKIASAALGIVDRHELLRQAALQAQEDYDAYMEGKATSEREVEVDSRSIVSDVDNVEMSQTEIEPLNDSKEIDDAKSDSNEKITDDSTTRQRLSSSSDLSYDENLQSLSKSDDSTEKPKEDSIIPEDPFRKVEPVLDDDITIPDVEKQILPSTLPDASSSPIKSNPVNVTTTSTKAKPVSMEDALLNLMDDDSDDDDDDE